MRLSKFIIALIKNIVSDDIAGLANALTYKLLLSLFPFIIFIMAVLGFLNIDAYGMLSNMSDTLPPQVFDVIGVFVREVFEGRSISLLSASLFVTIFSASSGFRAIIKGINKSYGEKESRGPVLVGIISVGLVLLFTAVIVTCLITLTFGGYILALAERYYDVSHLTQKAFAILRSFGAIIALLVSVCIIYKTSSIKKVGLISVLPGATVTVVIWILTSKAFEIYMTNFSRFSVVYGSLAGVFVVMIWLNLISFILLVGSEINALLDVYPGRN